MEGSRDLENVEKELKLIRYQSETYSKVTSVINRVNIAFSAVIRQSKIVSRL